MANLKRNMIELLKNPDEVIKGGEPEFEKYWTSPFIPTSVMLEALDLQDELEKVSNGELDVSQRDMFDKWADFVANKVYNKQFTKKQLMDSLHAPSAMEELSGQIIFVSQGNQTDATKKFLDSGKKR